VLADWKIKARLMRECGSVLACCSSSVGVRRVPLSCRDVEELLAERGIEVDRVTVFRWVQRFMPMLADAARFARHAPGDPWFVDETYVKVNGVWRYAYWAIDQHGQVIDVPLSTRPDAAAARRFFTRALRMLEVIPAEVVTDAAPVYPAVLEELVPGGMAPGLTRRVIIRQVWRLGDRAGGFIPTATPGPVVELLDAALSVLGEAAGLGLSRNRGDHY